MRKMDCHAIENRTDERIRLLADVWETSVRATHDFLRADEIPPLKRFVVRALRQVPHLVVAADAAGNAVAFMGVAERKIEMLFVAPENMGTGIGRRLVEYAWRAYDADSVDVNEENPSARAFYEHLGFRVAGRSAQDEQGGPHPILHMRRAEARTNTGNQVSNQTKGLGK